MWSVSGLNHSTPIQRVHRILRSNGRADRLSRALKGNDMSALKTVARFAMPLALLALGACATPFQAKVNRFQALPTPQGQTFVIRPADPKREGSLEFSQYAALVSQKLSQVGYQPAASANAASLIVTLDYGIDGGREKIRSVPGSGFGYGRFGGYGGFGRYGGFGYGGFGRGYRHSPYVYGFHDPFLFGYGNDEVESYTVYDSGLDMDITRKADGQKLFEGHADAMSLNNNLTYLVPNLVEAMFTGFPGNSGETVRITVAPPSKR